MSRSFSPSLSLPRALRIAVSLACFGALSLGQAATFVPTREEAAALLSQIGTFPDRALPEPDVDGMGRHYYAVDDMRFPVGGALDSVFNGQRWPGGTVYYQFDAGVISSRRQAWRDAAAVWSAVASVTFIEGVGAGNYVRVKASSGNNSYVGMIGGAQEMNISSWNSRYVIVHEIGHALGLDHEQSRPDRDNYVTILWNNIVSGQSHNFDISNYAVAYGSYDFDSVMHYSRTDFSANGQNTIEPKPPYASFLYTMGQHDHLSTLDAAGMAQRYTVTANLGNDHFANRSTISGEQGTVAGNNFGASREPGEPYHYASTGGASVWHKWTAPRDGTVVIDTEGSDFDTILAVYTGNGVAALTRVATDDDSGSGVTSQVSFSATSGTTYQIAVDGYSAGTGNYRLNWGMAGGPTAPANDNFALRRTLYGAFGTAGANNSGASSEVSEPLHAGAIGGASVWFTWTAPASGSVTIDTLQSNFDTLLAVYQGTSVGNLTALASNDNAPGTTQNSVTFNVVANNTYQIAVDGRLGANGNVQLRWSGPFLPNVKADFNGDGEPDILWQNISNGDRAIWFLRNTEWVAEGYLPRVVLAWKIVGTGDFNHDGEADILWQNTNGQSAIWFMRGGVWIGEHFLPTVSSPWKIAGTGDFNRDGHSDIVWQNTSTGQRAIWLMNGANHVGERFLPTVSTQWHIAGTGDFNHDGHIDLLWQDISNGQRAVWLMNETTHVGERFLSTIPPYWEIVGVCDLNRDNHVDLLWQNVTTGQRAVWFMNGTSHVGEQFLPTIPTNWEMRNR